jgi:WD40 repeat protein
LADLARQQNERENYGDAILLDLEALPKDMAQPDRPYVPEAEVQLYHAATRLRERLVLRGHYAEFSPDGKKIVTTDVATGRVWDAATGAALATLSGHEDSVYPAAFSPDGTRIVTASSDNTARVWDAATGTVLATLTGHEFVVYSAAFSPDGMRIVTASYDKTARVWRVFTTQELIDYANAIVPRRLTPEERKKYFLE